MISKVSIVLSVTCMRVFTEEDKYYTDYLRQAAETTTRRLEPSICNSKLAIQGCESETMEFSRRETIELRLKYKPDPNCNIIHTTFNWYFELENYTNLIYENYYNKDVFILEPYMIRGGQHYLNVNITEDIGDPDKIFKGRKDAECFIEMLPEDPVPIIRGPPIETVNAWQEFEVNGEDSIDYDVPSYEPGNLEFQWTCAVKGITSNFCRQSFAGKKIIIIPWTEAKPGAIFTLVLHVGTEDIDEYVTAVKEIRFEASRSTDIKINCVKNCPPHVQKSSSKEELILEAVCLSSCKGNDRDKFQWEINDTEFNYKANTLGRDDPIFHIKPNVLKDGETYVIRVILEGTEAQAATTIEMHAHPKLGSCKITPTSGEALNTFFSVDCQHDPGKYTFEIYSTLNDIDVFLDKGDVLADIRFTLTVGSYAKVRIVDEYRFSISEIIPVKVTSLVKTTGSNDAIEDNILDLYYDPESEFSITKLLMSKKYDDVFEAANSLVDDMNNLKKSGKQDLAQKYYTKILNEVEHIPLDSEDRARQLGALGTKATEAFSDKPDPEVAALGTKLCKKAGDKLLNDLTKKKYPKDFSEETIGNVEILTKCAKASISPNFDVLIPEIEPPVITTEFPLLEVDDNTENYPDYIDDQETSKATNGFYKASKNMIDLCCSTSKQLSIIMSEGDETMHYQAGAFNLTSTLKTGYEDEDTKIETHNIGLVLPKGGKSLHHVALCSSPKNIFWWTKKEIFASVAILQLNNVKGKSISRTIKPFLISFDTKSGITNVIKEHKMSPSRPVDNNLSRVERNYQKMFTHRIDVFGGQSFVVEFTDLVGVSALKVMITNFYKPNFGEFRRKGTLVDKNNNRLFMSNKNEFDSWYYLVAMPVSKSTSPPYKFKAYSMNCFSFDEEKANWITACQAISNSSTNHITCECFHNSAYTAMIDNNDLKLEEAFVEDLELEIQKSYTVIISLATAFLFYCIFFTWLTLASANEILDETIYFLSDVPDNFKHGYVLIVKTGNKANAGTTSNVTVKIYGKKAESKEHVLNYPDPQARLLQRNQENWFFLATEDYLGDVEKIDIWCDFIGFSPSWYCSEIEIFDIEYNKHWLLIIHQWFNVLRKEKIICTAFPVKLGEAEKSKPVIRLLKKALNSFHGAHMWNLMRSEEQTITRIKRLHIIYSIILMTYVIALFFYDCPKLETADVLGYRQRYGVDRYVLLITAGSCLLTFLIHFPVVWYFRVTSTASSLLLTLYIMYSYFRFPLKKSPVRTNFLCWLFLIINIIVSMTLLVILGFWVPYIISLLWLTSVILSLLMYIFVMENVMRLIVNLLTNQKTRVQVLFEKIKARLFMIRKQRSLLYNEFGSFLFRPYFEHLYKPPDAHRIKEQRYWSEIKERSWEIVEDLIMISIYVLLLYLVILMDRDEKAYISHLAVEELLQGIHSRTLMLEDVLHKSELEEFINDTVIFSMQSLQWYGQYVTKNPGMTVDNTNKYLGVARLRQHRTYGVPCVDNVINRSVCYPMYSSYPETRHFSEKWMDDSESNKFNRMDRVWNYASQKDAGTVQYVGAFAIYPGGGYIAPLGRIMENSITNWNYLSRNNWIDRMTRALFIEFLLYNAGDNLFKSVRIKFEMHPTGHMERALDVHTARLLFVKEEASTMIWVTFVSFLIILFILIVKIIFRILRKKQVFWKDIWYLVDIFIILMSITCLGLYVARADVVRLFLFEVEHSKNNEFVNYFHLLYTEWTLTIIAAALVFVATFRLWKLMRFMTIVKIVEKTLVLSVTPLLSLFLYQMVFTFACSFFAVVKYGDHVSAFRGVSYSLATLFKTALGFEDDFDADSLSNTLGYIFYSMVMLVFLAIITLYVAFITIAYDEAQKYYSNVEGYEVTDLLKEQLTYYKEMIKIKWKYMRFRGGCDKKFHRNVTPKADEFRYDDCITVPSSRMRAMGLVARCVTRNMNQQRELKITHRDADLMRRTLVNLLGEESERKDIFLMAKTGDDKVRLIDDRVLLKMERITEIMLSRKSRKKYKKEDKTFYKEVMESQLKQLDEMVEKLDIVLHSMNSIVIIE